MSDPKTSPSDLSSAQPVVFQDRLYVAGNASFLCLLVAFLWTECFITRATFSAVVLFVMAAPLVATGASVLLIGVTKHLIPKTVISSPLQFTVPIIWCLVCYLAITLISTQETSSMSVPDQLIPALSWLRLTNLIPVCGLQMCVLSIASGIEARRNRE